MMADTGFNGATVEWRGRDIVSLVNVRHVREPGQRRVYVDCNSAVADRYPAHQTGALKIEWNDESNDGSMPFARVVKAESIGELDCAIRTRIIFEDISDRPAG